MVVTSLLAAASFAFAAAIVYWLVGHRLSGRRVEPEARLPALSFSVWWQGLAATTMITGVQYVMGAFGRTDLGVFLSLTYLNLVIVCGALGCLMYYFIFLFTGARWAWKPLSVFYFGYLFLLFYFIQANTPEGVIVERWRATIDYATPQEGPLFKAVVLLLLLPQIVGSLAYFTLIFRVREPALRFRIAVVSWSIIIWFGTALLAASLRLANDDWWQLVSRFLGLGAALAILLAYYPPEFLRRRWGLVAAGDALPGSA